MTVLTTSTRLAGLMLCVVAFAGTAAAGNGGGNGNGNGNGKAGAAPGQAKKAEAPAPAPAAAPAPAPAAAPQPAAKAEEKQAEKQEAKAASKATAKADKKAPAAAAKASKPNKVATQQNESRGRSAEAHHHVIVCHRTGSDSNPYVVINIPMTAWTEAHSPDTGSHPELNGRKDKLLKDPASRPGSKDGFTKDDCGAPAAPPSVQQQPTDVCPNVEGMQKTVPHGLVKDASGNCVAPAAQVQVDVCPNIEGMQTTIPAGLVKDALGNCVTPVAAVALDVCVNIEGMQTTVPAGLVRNAEGNCVAPAAPAAAVAAAPAKEQPAGEVLGAVSPAAEEKPAGGVLGEVASAPEAIAETAPSGNLPFTGIPLWIAALLGGGLLAAGLVLRRASATR